MVYGGELYFRNKYNIYISHYKISLLLIRNGISRPRLLCIVAAVCALAAAAADELYIKINDENALFSTVEKLGFDRFTKF